MKKWVKIVSCVCILSLLAGCGQTESNQASQDINENQGQEVTNTLEDTTVNASDTEMATETNVEETASEEEATDDKLAAVVYFSATGNTEAIAQSMAEELSLPIYEIVPTQEYTSADLSYNDDNCRANKEQNDDAARPEIANDLSEVTEYSTIYLGYPVWWNSNPRIIQTFLETYDLSGKTVYTFCTSGSSGIETSVANLQRLYPDVNIVSGRRFETGSSAEDIVNWYNSLQ